MSLQLNDRVKETSITTGTVPIVLNGASIGYQNVASSISSSNTFPYVVELTGGNEWEIGIGQYVSGNNSIIRTQILGSSNAGNIVNFSSGSKNVFITVPAAYTALTARGLSQFSATSSAELASIISDETGSGKLVFSNNAILVTPDIGRANGTSLTLSGDLSVTGNVYLSGNVTTLSSNNLSINDSLIYLAQDNPANLQDIGIVGHFTTDHYQHTGFVRDASDGVWKLFSNVAAEPTTTVDFTGVVYDTVQVGTLISSNAVFSVANGSQPFSIVSNTLVANLNADLLDGQHGTYYTDLSSSAYGQANTAYVQANTGITVGQAAYTQANTGSTLAQSKVTSFYQNTSPATSNTKDTWIHSDTGVKYENVGNTSNPVWIECGPTGVANNSIPGIVSGTSVLSSNGVYSTGAYTGAYTDGIVLDYVNGNGRISVGANDGIKFYNSGTGANTLLTISPAGQVYSNYTGANAGATLMLSGNNTIGGSGYFDFLKVTNNAPGATNPSKTIRLNVTGGLEIIDNAYGNTLFLMDNSGQIITNGYGLLTTNRPAFRVIGSGGSISSTTTMTSSNWTVDFNQGNYLNSSTGIFTAPVQGLYQVNVVVRTNSNSYNGISQIIIQKTAYSGGATSTQIMVEFGNNTSMNHAGGSAIVKMAVGDTLKFIVSAGTISFDGNDNWSVAYIG